MAGDTGVGADIEDDD